MTRRITIKEAKAAIRAGRRIQWISRYPVEAKILSSDASYHHVVTGDTETPLWCHTCEGKGYRAKCWAVRRIEEAIIEMASTLPAEAKPVADEPIKPEPAKHQPMSWREMHAAARAEALD